MTVFDLKEWLDKLTDKEDGYEVDVMIETAGTNRCQYQFPLNDLAVSFGSKKIVLMHEKWGREDKK